MITTDSIRTKTSMPSAPAIQFSARSLSCLSAYAKYSENRWLDSSLNCSSDPHNSLFARWPHGGVDREAEGSRWKRQIAAGCKVRKWECFNSPGGLGFAMPTGAEVGAGVGVDVPRRKLVGVSVGVDVSMGALVGAGVGVGMFMGALVGVSVSVNVPVGTLAGVGVGVDMPMGELVGVSISVNVPMGALAGVGIGRSMGVLVGVSVGVDAAVGVLV